MSISEFPSFSTESRGQVTLLRFSQDLDGETAMNLQNRLKEVIEDETTSFLVDMENVSFLDSHGVGLFAILLKRAHERGGQLGFSNVDTQPRSVLQMVGFESLAKYYESTEMALEDMEAKGAA